MSSDNPQDRPSTASTERATEIQSPEGLGASLDLSLPRHVAQHAAAPKITGYVLAELLGEGAYGQVWRAWQLRTRKEVAVKVFKKRGGLDWIFLQREIERLLRLDRHPHVVTLLDAGLDSDPPFYVIDLLSGGSLQQFVRPDAPAGRTKVIEWARQMCDALGYVHRKGLIHCDLKPANVLVDEQDRVRVVDFGQSRVFTESAASLGTLFYMAPEQARVTKLGQPVQPDVRWDVYALGATLFSILTGRVSHATAVNIASLDNAATLDDRLERYRGMIAAAPVTAGDRELATAAGTELAAVVAKCMAPKPEDRYDAMAEIRSDLDAMDRGRPVSPLAHHRRYRVRKFVQRNPLGVALAVAVVALMTGGLMLRAEREKGDRAAATGILTRFVQDPAQAAREIAQASKRVKAFLADETARYVASPAFTERIKGARAGPWSNPVAFWESVDGGLLFKHGEWLELATMQWPEPATLFAQLKAKAISGSSRQKYTAFCLIGQKGGQEAELAELCVQAVRSESNPGVVSAARWAAARLGRPEPCRTAGDIFVDDLSSLAFVRIPGCESFQRGVPPTEAASPNQAKQSHPGRPVASFYLATTEVTAGAFTAFMSDPAEADRMKALIEASPQLREPLALCTQALQAQIDRAGLEEPAGWLSLDTARSYCAWLNVRGAAAAPRRRYRLPAEDEWEYACRAENPGWFCFGDRENDVPLFANCCGFHTAGFSPPVGQKMPNMFGLFDMHGNLWEWTDSRMPPEAISDPRIAPEQASRLYILRGGAYYSPSLVCSSAQRNYSDASQPSMYWGFRIVMEMVGK
ncbi:MAG: SUMF1/EgtB/PvdO family nonheme iron enzyme [Phycisphaerae bacterium]|nr:SUMF1/EgtB/PvdO family nonheme iron enzyme [Phycisphaerae bacterium]